MIKTIRYGFIYFIWMGLKFVIIVPSNLSIRYFFEKVIDRIASDGKCQVNNRPKLKSPQAFAAGFFTLLIFLISEGRIT